MKTTGKTKSQSDEKIRSGEANKFEGRHAELERKIKYKAVIAATTQEQGMTESTVKMRSGRIVAESEHEQMRLDVKAAAALHSNGIAFAETTESEQADGGPVEDAAAALDLDDEASITAATCVLSEETNASKSRPVKGMKRSKGEKHKLKELSKRIKKCIRERKRAKRQEKIQQTLEEIRGIKSFSCVKTERKSTLIPKVKNDTGETITYRKGIANVFGEFYSKLYAKLEKKHQCLKT